MNKHLIITYTIALILFHPSAFAATAVGVDAGSDGFTGWTENNTSGDSGLNGRFLGVSGTTMDTSGNSWGFYANSGQTASSYYDLSSALVAGDTVSIQLSLGFINSGGVVGIGFQNSAGVNRFETYYRGGDATDAFKINDAGGEENVTGVTTAYSSSNWINDSASQTILFTQGAGNTYDLSFNGTSITNLGLNLTNSDISRIRIFNFNAGNGNNFNQYANNLTVTPVPEPSTAALFLLAGGGLMAFSRRRK
ncbi:MAG: PEP-CTERM sorting domain-containing protein [Akkermansiaceae bacterium]